MFLSVLIVADGLEAYARVVKRHPEHAPTDRSLLLRLASCIKTGSPLEAKHAMVILAHGSASTEILTELLDGFLETLRANGDQQRLHNILNALGELARYAPTLFDQKTSEIVDILFKDILRKSRIGVCKKTNCFCSHYLHKLRLNHHHLGGRGKFKGLG